MDRGIEIVYKKNEPKTEHIVIGGKYIGYINYETKTYVTRRKQIHLFHIFNNGFGLSERVFDYLLDKGIEKVIVIYEESVTYIAKIADFLVYGKEWTDTSNGYKDKQIILEGQYWKNKLQHEMQVRL